MAYISGEHWVRCTHCGARIYRSDAVKDRTGLLACKKHVDKRQIGIDYPTIKLKQDPRPVVAGNLQGEGADVFYSNRHWESTHINWEDDTDTWEAN